MQWQEEQRKKREADLAAAAAEDKILAELAAAAAAEKSCYPLRLTQTSRHGCCMTSSPWDEILTAYKAGLSPSSGEAGKLRPPRAENPGLSCRCTRSSNPSPSSRQSVSLRISPAFQEKPRFSAILAATPGGKVARDTAEPSNIQKGALVSLSADIPVPQCCPMRLATLAALATSKVRLAPLWSFEFGSAYAKPSKPR